MPRVRENNNIRTLNYENNSRSSKILGKPVRWLRGDKSSPTSRKAKKILAIVLASFLSVTVIGIIPVVLGARVWKKQSRKEAMQQSTPLSNIRKNPVSYQWANTVKTVPIYPSIPKIDAKYRTVIPRSNDHEDPIFSALDPIDISEFNDVATKWLNLDWVKKLDPSTQRDFETFLSNITLEDVPRQNEVFGSDSEKTKGYEYIKKGVVYLFEKLQDNPDLGEMVILMLNTSINECPLSYFSCIKTGIGRVQNSDPSLRMIDMSMDSSIERIHKFYSSRRTEIVDSLATSFGRKETHTPNSILGLIGKERNIPGYRMVLADKHKDIFDEEKGNLLSEFDRHNTPSILLQWMEEKINGKKDSDKTGQPLYHLHQEIPFLIATKLNADIDKVRELVFDENYLITQTAIAACLEIADILRPQSQSSSALRTLQNALHSS